MGQHPMRISRGMACGISPPSGALLFTPGNSGPGLPDQILGVPYWELVTALNGTGPFTLLAGPTGMTLTNIDSTHFLLQNPNPTGSGAVSVTVQSTT